MTIEEVKKNIVDDINNIIIETAKNMKTFNDSTGYKLGEFNQKLRDGEISIVKNSEMGSVSDGSHTFDDLYYHRMILFSILCKMFTAHSWRARQHNDNTMYPGYFIAGVNTPNGQYSYHYKLCYWDEFEGVWEYDKAPIWDGHTADDIIRLKGLIK